MIVGTLKDIEPNGSKPRLELSFSRVDSVRLPLGNDAPLTLKLGDETWRASLANRGTNRAYVRTWLQGQNGGRETCTNVFARLGLAHDTLLEFTEEGNDVLILSKVVQPGVSRSVQATRRAIAGQDLSSIPKRLNPGFLVAGRYRI